MHWKNKAKIQNLLAKLPSSLSYEAYYQAQRWLGGLRNSRISDLKRIDAAVSMWRLAKEAQFDPQGKVFFEVGTGRTLSMPVAYWLMGADSTITVDLNRYLKSEITHQVLVRACGNDAHLKKVMGEELVDDRLNELKDFLQKPFRLSKLLELCHIQYIAPGDATSTALPEDSIDIHTSFTVYEHIPADVLEAITLEANRITKDEGLFVHGIDYSDHFAHSDNSISRINFLQYSQDEWDNYAGNRYMYMNRLRHDDYLDIFRRCGQEVVVESSVADEKSKKLLDSDDFRVHEYFADKSVENLAAVWGWLVLRQPHAAH